MQNLQEIIFFGLVVYLLLMEKSNMAFILKIYPFISNIFNYMW